MVAMYSGSFEGAYNRLDPAFGLNSFKPTSSLCHQESCSLAHLQSCKDHPETVRKVMNEDEIFEFPNKLEDFGYRFNEEGALRSIDGDQPYNFEVREDDYNYNQQHYDALGNVVTEWINKVMEKKYKLQKTYLPTDAEPDEARTYAYISGDLYTNNDKLMIIIHGSGQVRAGQWSRRLIINDDLDKGSQLPFIKWAKENGFSLIIANTNDNFVDERKKKPVPIRGNGSPEEHVETLWREFVQRSPAKNIAILAHSYGGVCVAKLCSNHIREFEERVFAIALTDSVHGLRKKPTDQDMVDFFKEHAINWASAYDPLDAQLHTPRSQCPTISAGTDCHELTSYSSMNSIFKWLPKKYDQKVNPEKYKKDLEAEQQNLAHETQKTKETESLIDLKDDYPSATGNQPNGELAKQIQDMQMNDNSAVNDNSANQNNRQKIDSQTEENLGIDEAKVKIVDENRKSNDVKVEL